MKPLAALILFASPLHAAQESRTVETSFYCFQYVPGAETIQVVSGDHEQPVRLSTANISKPVTLSLDGENALLHQRTVDKLTTAAKVKIPANIAKALIVLVPAPSGSAEPYRAFAIDYSHDRFPLGSYHLVNISARPIRGAIGRSYAEVKPGGIGDISLQGDDGAVLGAKFEFLETGKWNRLTETRCAVRRDRRWLVCVFQDPATQRMNLRSIPDRSFTTNTTVALAE